MQVACAVFPMHGRDIIPLLGACPRGVKVSRVPLQFNLLWPVLHPARRCGDVMYKEELS